VGRLFGIPIRIHWTFILLVAVIVASDWKHGRITVLDGLIWIAVLFTCVVAHEIAHCLVARRRGASVLGILLLPIGGLSQLNKMPERPDDELAVALVGPMTSLAIGVVALVLGLLLGDRMWPPTLFAGSWSARVAWLNLALGAFNLLPALPMDGGRVLHGYLARSRSRLEATRAACHLARWLAALMIVFGFLYDIWFMLIGIFVLLGANAEEQAALVHDASDRGHQRT
jgi:stage IV sporulation protein FB